MKEQILCFYMQLVLLKAFLYNSYIGEVLE